jgi:hypothetical protein
MNGLIYEGLTYKIRGALFEVYKEKGGTPGAAPNYLKTTGYKLGLLAKFGHHPQIHIERIAN